jgi:threonine dehydratase
LNFLDRLPKKYSNIKVHEIRTVGAEVFHADRRTDGRVDGQTDMTKLIGAFHKFASAPNKAYDVPEITIA